jgi:hypothetical protein
MMVELADVVADNRRFYESSLQGITGPVLECACGTGIVLLPLLAAGHDIYGFDISTSMLAALTRKAATQGIAGVAPRLSVQEFTSFQYDRRFAAAIIPTNTFSMLTTQDAQIRTLQNIRPPGPRRTAPARFSPGRHWRYRRKTGRDAGTLAHLGPSGYRAVHPAADRQPPRFQPSAGVGSLPD